MTYHSLDESDSVLSTPPRIFAEHMAVLSKLDAEIVSLKEIGRKTKPTGDTKPMIAITFDDGFRNVYEHGFPVLRHYGFPATIFLVTDYCGKVNSWPSQPAGIMCQPLLTWNQIKEMSQAGVTFGSHTRTHPNLTEVSTHDTEEELIGSKKAIEDVLGVPADMFAYPYGAFNETVRELVEHHFALAFSTALGFAHSESDPFAVERLDMYYLRHPLLLQRLFSRAMGSYIGLRRTARAVRQWLAI